MFNYQSVISHAVIIIAFTFVWVTILTYKFHSVGAIIDSVNFDTTAGAVVGFIIPVLLFFFVFYRKSNVGYGVCMFLFAMMFLIIAGQLPNLLEIHLYGTSDSQELDLLGIINESPFTIGLYECLELMPSCAIGFALMNTKTLVDVYSWNINKSRVIFFIAILTYTLSWIIYG